MNRFFVVSWLSLILIFVGCASSAVDEAEVDYNLPTPTKHPFFQNATGAMVEATPDLLMPVPALETPVLREMDLPTETLLLTRDANVQTLTGLTYADLLTTTIYDDALDANWRVLDSEGVEIDLANTDFVYNGRFSISMTPSDSWQTLYFAVDEETTDSFRQSDVLSVSFQINGGDAYIDPENLAFTFVGSNENRYWVADDRSAYFDDQYPFSETAFYWFDLNDAIPPNTWVEIEVFVHEQIYDPTYTYITGFYIKNGEDFLNTIYVDDVKINRLPNPNAEPTRERSETNNDGAVGPMVTPELTLTPTSILTTTIETTPTATITDVTACVVDPPENWVSYTVQPGDTASSLSVRSGISVEYLATVNCLPSAAVLSVNRDIWLPAQIETITATPAPPPALTATPSP